jgi:UDP-N-acetylglucosamine diphosphorylase / glucose-1-phosphate thymidylyltransferase / UDP-N-acetylgalactosamine diphosphorylase / glucosamine-1-phosphate N-acetyltransferase / galactosamine-1-phosphate N-acetyltransferase
MNIVLPMAGRGSRFASVGVTTPKPLIDVRGKPMYAWAMASLPLALADRLIFICLAEHLEDPAIADDIRTRYSGHEVEIVALDHVTRGQAETVLAAKSWINSAESLVIFNADTYMTSDFERNIVRLASSVDGVFGVFEAPGEQWSFARTDDNGRVLETAEKRRIGRWASTGLYHFSRGADFVRHTEAMIAADDRERGEFYVAPVYNRLIAEGAEIVIDAADAVWGLGTPEDLAVFEATYKGKGPTP